MIRDRHEPERILITGYGGFVAPYLAATCARRYPNAHLFGLTHSASRSANHEFQRGVAESDMAGSMLEVTEVEGDITDRNRLQVVLQETRPDVIFHLAATSSVAFSWQDPAEVLRVNAGGFIHMAQALRELRSDGIAPRVIVSGSGEQYGLIRQEENPVSEDTLPRPANPYAVSKVTQDLSAFQFHRAYGLDVVRARAFNHFGPGQSTDFVVANFARQIACIEAGQSEPTLLVGNLSAQRDFLAVGDVVEAYMALAERGQAGEAYNIGSGIARSIDSVLHLLLEMAQVPISVNVDPARFRPADVPVICANTAKIQQSTGWSPKSSLEDSLHATLNYWRTAVVADRGIS